MADILKTRRSRIIGAVVGFVLSASLVAVAAWLVSGTGPGTTQIGTLVAPTITAGTLAGNEKQCFPGGTCDGVFAISNPNGALVVTGLSDGGMGTGTCADQLLTNPQTGLSIPVPAGSSTVTVPNAFALATAAPSSCQGTTATRVAVLQFATP